MPNDVGKYRDVALPAEMHSHADEDEELDELDDEEEEQGDPESLEVEEEVRPNRPVAVPARASTADPKLASEVQSDAVKASIQRAQEESQTIGGRPGPAKATTGEPTRTANAARLPVVDVDKMSDEEVRENLKRLIEERRRAPGIPIQKVIRWNNGSEPNVQGGEIVSGRDSGSVSVYGFGRRPITFYAGQWVQLAHYMPDILHFIEKHREEMNEYVAERMGNRSKDLSEEDIQAALKLFVVEQEHEHKEERKQATA